MHGSPDEEITEENVIDIRRARSRRGVGASGEVTYTSCSNSALNGISTITYLNADPATSWSRFKVR